MVKLRKKARLRAYGSFSNPWPAKPTPWLSRMAVMGFGSVWPLLGVIALLVAR
jgi:hypothetical protein